jgi:hypothetical protein
MRNCLPPKEKLPTATCAGVRWNALECARVRHNLGTITITAEAQRLHGKVRRLGPLEDLVDVRRRLMGQASEARPIGNESSSLHECPVPKGCRQAPLDGVFSDGPPVFHIECERLIRPGCLRFRIEPDSPDGASLVARHTRFIRNPSLLERSGRQARKGT